MSLARVKVQIALSISFPLYVDSLCRVIARSLARASDNVDSRIKTARNPPLSSDVMPKTRVDNVDTQGSGIISPCSDVPSPQACALNEHRTESN